MKKKNRQNTGYALQEISLNSLIYLLRPRMDYFMNMLVNMEAI